MYLLHKALRAEAGRAERLVEQLEGGENLRPFILAFERWRLALGFHAEMEDKYMTALLPDAPLARDNETAHQKLGEGLTAVQVYLQAMEQSGVTARTRRHLFGKVVDLRIAQDDHLEEEEELVLPIIRQRLDEEQQLEIARRLLLDQGASHEAWVLELVARDLTLPEQQWLAGLEARFAEVLANALAPQYAAVPSSP
jgi:hypothetical protein